MLREMIFTDIVFFMTIENLIKEYGTYVYSCGNVLLVPADADSTVLEQIPRSARCF
jgi:hypothetical protein